MLGRTKIVSQSNKGYGSFGSSTLFFHSSHSFVSTRDANIEVLQIPEALYELPMSDEDWETLIKNFNDVSFSLICAIFKKPAY